MSENIPRSRLPHALAALYALAIAYASLQPFSDWITPPPGSPFWLVAPWTARWTRPDAIANLVAYLPLGFFVALVPRSAGSAARLGLALGAGASLSFAMETLQTFIPARAASAIDFASNSAGAALGAWLAIAWGRRPAMRTRLAVGRARVFLSGAIGDIGLALLALWVTAHLNPAIPLFAVAFESELTQAPLALAQVDVAGVLIEAASSAFQLLGIGLFITLLVRNRRYAGGAVIGLVAMALVAKGIGATLLLKPAAWETWLRPGVLLGVAAGALLLLFAVFLPRAAQVAICAIALLSSVLTPMLAPDLLLARAPLWLFSWRYGHLLNFNGLSQAVLLVWPLIASAWLFALAGKPRWGHPG